MPPLDKTLYGVLWFIVLANLILTVYNFGEATENWGRIIYHERVLINHAQVLDALVKERKGK